MGAGLPKQYLHLAGRPVIEHALRAVLDHPAVRGAVVVLAETDRRWRDPGAGLAKPVLRAPGGAERCHSVLNGLAALTGLVEAGDWVLVHDAARPCLRGEDLRALVKAVEADPVGGLLAVPVRDTMKRAGAGGRVAATVERRGLWHALTPQMFRYGPLTRALEACLARGEVVTDEASAMEAAGLAPRLVEGHADNIKVTHPADLGLAEFFLARRSESGACA